MMIALCNSITVANGRSWPTSLLLADAVGIGKSLLP